MMTMHGEYVGVDPLVGRICTDVERGGRYVRSVYGPFHRIVGGASAGDIETDLVTTACGIDLPRFDSVVHPPDSMMLPRGGAWVAEHPRCGDCFSTTEVPS